MVPAAQLIHAAGPVPERALLYVPAGHAVGMYVPVTKLQ